MKKSIIGIFLISLIAVSCSKKNDATPANARILTASPWKMQSVSLDNVDVTNSFTGLTLNFTSNAYTSTNGKVVWPSSGTWKFTDANSTTLLRDDQVSVHIDMITDNNLVLSLDWATTTLGGGRQKSIQGHHVFTFTH